MTVYFSKAGVLLPENLHGESTFTSPEAPRQSTLDEGHEAFNGICAYYGPTLLGNFTPPRVVVGANASQSFNPAPEYVTEFGTTIA